MEQLNIRHITPIRVRYADTDQMGYVYNGNYFEYFEVGRCELMRHYGLPYTILEQMGYFLPLIEAQASYVAPALYDDLLSVEALLNYSYSPTLRFEYNIFRDKTTIARGYTVHTFLSKATRRPVKPPRVFIEALAAISEITSI